MTISLFFIFTEIRMALIISRKLYSGGRPALELGRDKNGSIISHCLSVK